MVIIYPDGDGIAVISPVDCGIPVVEIALKDVPEGMPFLIVSDVPADRTFREAWEADFASPDGYGGDWGVGSSMAVVGYDAAGQARVFRDDAQSGANQTAKTVYTRSAASIRKAHAEIANPKGPAPAVNIDRARSIAHGLRQSARSVEFAPLDALIAARVPGTDETAIEAQRQEIRDRYAAIQTEIDAAETVDELTAIVGGL